MNLGEYIVRIQLGLAWAEKKIGQRYGSYRT